MLFTIKRENIFAFLVALTVLISGAYSVYRHYDFSYSEDAHSYMKMAQGDFQHLSMTHQYRFIAPAIAGLIAQPIDLVYSKIWTERSGIEWSVRLSFFIENVLLMAIIGLFLFRLARNEGVSFWYALVAMIFLLTNRWGIDNAALPLVEALYLLCVVLLAFSIQTNSLWLQLFAVFLGCFAKEAFVFELPVLLLFSQQSKLKLVAGIVFTGIIVWTTRYYINQVVGASYPQEIANFTRHFYNIETNLLGALKPKGWFETFSAVGLGGVFILYGLFNKEIRLTAFRQIPAWAWAIGLSAVVQGSLGEWGRMLYYACPLYVLLIAKVLQFVKIETDDGIM
jgi:hypothetical protein